MTNLSSGEVSSLFFNTFNRKPFTDKRFVKIHGVVS